MPIFIQQNIKSKFAYNLHQFKSMSIIQSRKNAQLAGHPCINVNLLLYLLTVQINYMVAFGVVNGMELARHSLQKP